MAGAAAIFNATDPSYDEYLRPFESRDIVVVANSMDQAQLFIRTVRGLLEGPKVDPRIYMAVNWEACRQDLIAFAGDVTIRAMPLSSRSSRGPACSLLIFDESGHFQAGGEGVGEGNEVYQALAPTTAQFGPAGHIMFTSTPKLRMGLFWEQYRNGIEGRDPALFVNQRATWEINLNPNLTREELEKKFPGRPEWVATEYGADFSSAEGAFLDPDDIQACQRATNTLPPQPNVRYKMAIDPAFQKDNFAAAIAHKEKDLVVIDGTWVWHKQGYENTLNEVMALAQRYGVRQVRTDQFSSQSVLEGLQKRKIECEVVPWANENKFDAFSRLKAGLMTRQVELPRDDATEQELMNLQATATVTGMVRIQASSGNHDDRATVIAALMDMLEGDHGPLIIDRRQWSGPQNALLDLNPYAQISNDPFDSWPLELD